MDEPERYVRRIMANASKDRWRLAARRPERPLRADDVLPAAADQAAAVADRDFLVRVLAVLPPRQRTVLVLRYFSDLPDAEIAVTLGCSTGTVKSQASRGLARLRAMTERDSASAGQIGEERLS
jgi:RNA polymerase sigma factor (sigma-70 family)